MVGKNREQDSQGAWKVHDRQAALGNSTTLLSREKMKKKGGNKE